MHLRPTRLARRSQLTFLTSRPVQTGPYTTATPSLSAASSLLLTYSFTCSLSYRVGSVAYCISYIYTMDIYMDIYIYTMDIYIYWSIYIYIYILWSIYIYILQGDYYFFPSFKTFYIIFFSRSNGARSVTSAPSPCRCAMRSSGRPSKETTPPSSLTWTTAWGNCWLK